jgi:hypothetical protein
MWTQEAGSNKRMAKVHNEEFRKITLHHTVIKEWGIRWMGRVARIEEIRTAYKISVEKPEGNRPLRRAKCKKKDNVKTDLK